jgi:hypothetical protein
MANHKVPTCLLVLVVAADLAAAMTAATTPCTASVDPAAVPPLPAGACAAINPCLAAMPAHCATKTLLLLPGKYYGVQNTQVNVSGTDSVAIVGPVAPAPLLTGPGKEWLLEGIYGGYSFAGELQNATYFGIDYFGAAGSVELRRFPVVAAPPTAAVATIDGGDREWLFAVSGNATLRLENVALVRGRSSVAAARGGALHVAGSGAVNATSVLFDSNTANGTTGSALFTCSDSTAQLFSGCAFRNNNAIGASASAASVGICTPNTAAQVAPTFRLCLFEGNDGGGVLVDAFETEHLLTPSFEHCLFYRNVADGPRVKVSGGNDGNAKNLQACTGACDSDAQCATGLKCFQRQNGEAIPGCDVSTAPSKYWGYCYDPNFSPGACDGGGTLVYAGAPRFRNCTWHSNRAGCAGGGVYVEGHNHLATAIGGRVHTTVPVFDHCRFMFNDADYLGGGTSISDASPHFSHCIWFQNEAAAGGGTDIWSSSGTSAMDVAFENCIFHHNHAWGEAGGGALITTTFAKDTPANLAFKNGSCSEYFCEAPLVSTNPPPVIENVFRRWTHHLGLQFTGNTTFLSNTAGFGHRFWLGKTIPAPGGALHIRTGGNVTIRGIVSFRQNNASTTGGAVHLAVGSASLVLQDAVSSWVDNSAGKGLGSGRGDHLFSGSGSGLALGNATLRLRGEPTREREGVVAPQSGNVSWGEGSSVTCEAGYALSASTTVSSAKIPGWVLEGSSNGTAGFRAGSNCPGYFARCDGRSSKNNPGLNDPEAEPVSPEMLVTQVSVGCAACGTTLWSDPAPQAGSAIAAAAFTPDNGYDPAVQLGRNCSACKGRMSPGIDCQAGLLFQKAGWWRPRGGVGFETELFRCYTDTCVGSTTNVSLMASSGTTYGSLPSHEAQCKEGHSGPVCALCAEGYVRSGGGACKICQALRSRVEAAACGGARCKVDFSDDTSVDVYSVLMVLLSVSAFLTCCTCYRWCSSRTCLGRAKKGVGTFKQLWEDAKANKSCIKIVIGFYSLLAVLDRTFSIPWPGAFQEFLAWAKGFLLSPTAFSSVACTAFGYRSKFNHYDELLFWTVGLLVFIAGIWLYHAWEECNVSSSADKQRGRAARSAREVGHTEAEAVAEAGVEADTGAGAGAGAAKLKLHKRRKKWMFHVLLFAYPLVCPSIIATLICREIDGTRYLEADYSLKCGTPSWGRARWWSLLWLLVYVLGMPAVVSWAVSRRDSGWAFVGDSYHDNGVARYWEVLEIVRKLLLSAGVLYFNKGTSMQITVAVLLSAISLVVHALYEPFKKPSDNRLQTLALSSLLATYFSGLLAKVQPDAVQEAEFGWTLTVLGSVVGVFALVNTGLENAKKVGDSAEEAEKQLALLTGSASNDGGAAVRGSMVGTSSALVARQGVHEERDSADSALELPGHWGWVAPGSNPDLTYV